MADEPDVQALSDEAERGYPVDKIRPASSHAALAFAATEAIERGDWDRYLVRLQAAISARMKSSAWQNHIVAGIGDDPQWKDAQR